MNVTTQSSTPIVFPGPDEIASRLVDIAFDEDASAAQLSLVVMAFAAFWFAVFYIVKSIVRPLVHNKPWLLEAIERDYDRATKKTLAELQIKMTKDEAIAWSMNDWPRMQCIYLQHIVGSLFCLPSLLGIGDPAVASSLAICGILSEIGWELQDMLEMLFVRAFFKNGKAIWPDSIVFIFLLHHSLSSVLGVPMVLYYRHSRSLHWMCFDLQFAAAVALMINEYTKLLDISKPSSLRQFKWFNGLAFVTMLWTRVIHWSYLCVDLFVTWYNEEAYVLLCIGVVLTGLFSMFSFLACVKPFYKKFVKFLNVSAEYEALPPDAAPKARRESIVKLDEAAAALLVDDDMETLADIVERTFVKRRPSRRQSLPVQRRKRHSLVMFRACSFGHEILGAAKKEL